MVEVMANGRRTPSTTTTFFVGLEVWVVVEKDDDDNGRCCRVGDPPTNDAVALATTKPPEAEGP